MSRPPRGQRAVLCTSCAISRWAPSHLRDLRCPSGTLLGLVSGESSCPYASHPDARSLAAPRAPETALNRARAEEPVANAQVVDASDHHVALVRSPPSRWPASRPRSDCLPSQGVTSSCSARCVQCSTRGPSPIHRAVRAVNVRMACWGQHLWGASQLAASCFELQYSAVLPLLQFVQRTACVPPSSVGHIKGLSRWVGK